MIDDKLISLFKAICKKSQDNALSWQESAAKDVFIAQLGGYLLRIEADERDFVTLEVIDSDRNSIATFREREFRQTTGDLHDEIIDLYKSARNIALHVDDKVNELLQILN